MPGVQNPHCRAKHSLKPSWTGFRCPWGARPSTVVISRPAAWMAKSPQDFTAMPSRRMVQAPQVVVSQPTWVPVRRRKSRR